MPTIYEVIDRLNRGVADPAKEYSLRFQLRFREEDGEELSRMTWSKLYDAHFQLQASLRSWVWDAMQHKYELKAITYERGSITVVVIIGAVLGAYDFVSKYKDFADGLRLLTEHIRRMLYSLTSNPDSMQIEVSISEKDEDKDIGQHRSVGESIRTESRRPDFVVGYLVLSHAVLLGYLLWLGSRLFQK